MGSLSELKKSMDQTAPPVPPRYLHGQKTAVAGGAVAAGAGGLMLASSRKLVQRQTAARDSFANYHAANVAAQQSAAGRKAKRAATARADKSGRMLERANRIVSQGPANQRMLRGRGALLAAAGAGTIGYGAYARRRNQQAGY